MVSIIFLFHLNENIKLDEYDLWNCGRRSGKEIEWQVNDNGEIRWLMSIWPFIHDQGILSFISHYERQIMISFLLSLFLGRQFGNLENEKQNIIKKIEKICILNTKISIILINLLMSNWENVDETYFVLMLIIKRLGKH